MIQTQQQIYNRVAERVSAAVVKSKSRAKPDWDSVMEPFSAPYRNGVWSSGSTECSTEEEFEVQF